MTPSIYDKPVVIVGGGVTGLVTAHLLLEAGAKVVVIEKMEQVGGLARSYVYEDNFVFDCGPHRFDVTNPNVNAYVSRILKDRGTNFPRKSEVFFKGKYYDWPIKPQNLVQLPPSLAGKAFVDLTVNGFRNYGEDNFENYILRQYGPTLFRNFFEGYSMKFLGIHPRETHSDWAKVGINRAIIDDNAQMQNLFQLLKSTLLQFNKTPQRFVYPVHGMHEAWASVKNEIEKLGGTVHTDCIATVKSDKNRIVEVHADGEVYEPSQVVWTGPITQICKQLNLQAPQLSYLGLLLFNVMVKEDAPRDYQWCYYGASDLVFNRISTPRFLSPQTCPVGGVGYCCEVTCMVGDSRWNHGERLTDWVVDDLIKVGMISSRSSVIDVKIERLPHSYPIYHKDYPAELDKARTELSKFENLKLAGRTGLFWYNNMDHSMENAMQLTRRLLRAAGKIDIEEAKLAAGL
ncbi:MAG: FAD-dependent oxidoreductase [Myxococcota bacterium]|nr:FAD-dependent oxidoreductase [Myxococcota bacterium]